MAFPISDIFSYKLVGPILRRQLPVSGKKSNAFLELLHVKPSTDASVERLVEMASCIYLIAHIPKALKKSSAVSTTLREYQLIKVRLSGSSPPLRLDR